VTKTWVNGSEKKIELQNVLHSPDIGGRFLSILRIGEKGISVTFEGPKVIFSRDRVTYAEGQLNGRHYWLTLSCASPSVHSVQTRTPIDTLHARLGHLSWLALKRINDQIDPTLRHALSTCEGCLLGKSTGRKFKSSTHRRTQPFELIHMDLAGPMRMRSRATATTTYLWMTTRAINGFTSCCQDWI
jgi:hypothetical protein